MTGRMGRSVFFGLFLAGVLLQTGLARISSSNRYGNNEFVDGQPNPTPFHAGNEYIFEYNSQTASGLVDSSINEDEPQFGKVADSEKSVGRYQATAKINFISENRATLQLTQIRVGSMNSEWQVDLKRMQPMNMFEKMSLDGQFTTDIQLPCDFIYNDGIVERINFHPQDAVWSKNIKRAVLSHIQLNLKRKSESVQQQQKTAMESSSEEQFLEYSNDEKQLKNAPKAFVVPETSLQGICLTTYTINDNSKNLNSDKQSSRFNVTKSINFKNCRKIADMSFGYQPEENAKNAKCARQMENANPNGRFAPVDDESCDPKELDHTKLDRSTVQRIECVGRSSEKRCAIKRAETLSQYVLKNFGAQTSDDRAPSAMHTVVLTELIFRAVKSSPNPSKMSHFQLRDTSTEKCADESASCSLLYDNEWEMNVKQFYTHGDEQFNAQNSPFKTVTKKAEQALQIFRHLMLSANDKQNVMEGETVAQVQRLVHLLRMCTVEELKEIQNGVKNIHKLNGQNSRSDAQKAEQLLADVLAIAGTRNTVHVLIQKIYNGELSPTKAAQSLKSLHGSPAPSDSIATMLSELCKNELAHRTPALEQSCWLTFGKIVGDMCRDTISIKAQQQEQRPHLQKHQRQKVDSNEIEGLQEMIFGSQSGFNKAQVCPPMKKESYKQILIKNYQRAHTMYEKILALKTIGNAGLDSTVSELEKIISSKSNESPLIRAVSIDALRRLRWRMPRKIQRICLPIFQNVNERPEVRMTAFAALMNSQPEAPILDQILYTLGKERSCQVQSFVYSTAKALAASQVPQNQNNAKHLKSALQLTGVSEEDVLSDSGKAEMSFHSLEEREGAIIKLISMYNDKQTLPTQLALGIDSIFNGQKNLDRFRVSLAQQNTNGWLENAIEAFLGPQQKSQQQKMTRSGRSGATSSRRADEELRNIFSSLKMKSRQQPKSRKFAPLVMASLRIAEVDHAFIALERSSLSQPLRQLLEDGDRSSIVTIVRQLSGQLEKEHLRSLSAASFNEKTAYVPTSAGMPLKIAQSTPVLFGIDANAKVQQNGQALESSSIKASLNAHVAVTAVHLQNMELWTPVTAWGVMSKRSLEFNAPIQLEITGEDDDNKAENNPGVKVTLKVPQAPKTRLFGAHSFAATYVINQENGHRQVDAHTNNSIRMRVMRNPALLQTLSPVIELEKECFGEKTLGIPVCVSGHFHKPGQFTSVAQWLQIVMATENHIHVSIRPNVNGPSAISFRAFGSLFKRATSGQVNDAFSQLQNFYENAEDSFHPAYPEEYQDMKTESYSDRRQKLEKTIQKMIKNEKLHSFYKHALKFVTYTEGGNIRRQSEVKLQAICDARFKSCSIASELECAKCLSEAQPWMFKSKVQYLAPETVSSPEELQRLRNAKQQNLIAKIDAEWGADRKQYVNIRLQGNNAQPKNIDEQQKLSQWSAEEIKQLHHEKQRAVSFINNYECSVSYKLSPQVQSYATNLLDVVRVQNFWNSESQRKQSGRDGQVYLSLFIEPITAQQARLQLRTPSQLVKINDLQLPMSVRPMPLVKHGEKSIHSIAQFLTRTTRDATRDQCTVDSRRVETFDGARYKGPITNSCYSVLAKDCSNAEQPEFAVLMKSTSQNGQQKKIKVVTKEQVVECQVKQNADGEKKIECKINGELVDQPQHYVSSSEQQLSSTVEYNNEEQTSVMINAPSGAVSVRFACLCSNCECQKTTIQLANKHKYGQCGLCGHYDDTLADELRMSDDEQTQDLATFHRSYTMLSDMEGELCTKTMQDDFYKTNQNKFSMLNEEEWRNDQGYDSDNEDSQWQRKSYGGYATENSDEEHVRSYNSKKQIQPVMKTEVIEQDQRVCLSVEPVKQCPSGSVPVSSNEDSAWDSEDNGEVRNMQFVCMDRLDAYTHLRAVAKKGVAQNVQNDPAVIARFSKDVRQPVKCQRF